MMANVFFVDVRLGRLTSRWTKYRGPWRFPALGAAVDIEAALKACRSILTLKYLSVACDPSGLFTLLCSAWRVIMVILIRNVL